MRAIDDRPKDKERRMFSRFGVGAVRAKEISRKAAAMIQNCGMASAARKATPDSSGGGGASIAMLPCSRSRNSQATTGTPIRMGSRPIPANATRQPKLLISHRPNGLSRKPAMPVPVLATPSAMPRLRSNQPLTTRVQVPDKVPAPSTDITIHCT